MSAIATERLSDFLGLIYDCVLQPEKWELALGAICRELELPSAVLGYYETQSGCPLLRVKYGMAAEWFDRQLSYGAEMAAYWGGPERILSYPIGEVVAHSIAQPETDNSANRFALEWCAPQGIVDLAGFSLSADRTGLSSLIFTSRHRFAESGAHKLDVLRLLSPHLRRAAIIGKVLELKSIEAASFGATLDALPQSILLLDADAHVVHANLAAEALFKSNDGLSLVNGRLALRDAVANKALTAAVSRSASEVDLGQQGIGVPARGQSGAGAVLHVLPLRHGALRNHVSLRAVAALFITSAQPSSRLPAEALSLLYDLTPAEARVCELIAEGLAPSDIARRIGVAPSTARSHLMRVFEKTGTNRQSNLVRLVASLSIG
jgi:DNA-binding CsgD family transcriptional regulator/PAS domain-containing protein